MILSEVREYVRQRRQVSLTDIALHFDSSPDALRGMLDVWIKKGRMHKLCAQTSCGTCNGCDIATEEIYIWGQQAKASDRS